MWALDHIIVTLSCALVHTVGLLDEAVRTDLTRTITQDWFRNGHMTCTIYVADGCLSL